MCRPPPPALVLQQSKEAVVDEAVLLLQCCFCKRGSNCSIQAPEVSPAFLARVSLSDAGGLWLLGDTATRWFSRRSGWFGNHQPTRRS